MRHAESSSGGSGAALPGKQPVDRLNPALPEFRTDPYPFYHHYRTLDPVHWGLGRDPHGPGCWYLTRYADAATALMHPGLVQSRVLPPDELPPFFNHFRPLLETLHGWMVIRNPPDHARLRRAMSQAFTPSLAETLEMEIEEVANELIDRADQAGSIDLIGEFASPLTVITISRILGAPGSDWKLFRRWSTWFAQALDLHPDADAFGRAAQAARESSEYLRDLLAERRRNPRSDLISRLASAGQDIEPLSEDELISNCILLLFAGHETTVNLIGNGMLALWRHQQELEGLRRSLGLIASAVEELLRFDSPTQMVFRAASIELELGGQIIGKDNLVSVVLGAANRDPAQFAEPDRLDFARRSSSHLSFGRGIHSCMGAALARTEGEVAIKTLLRRMSDLEIQTGALEWRTDNVTLRGLKRLPLSFRT